ncbi:hypothetical protein LX87_03895 [Larkinella arboricola]|uniref:Uncharacterized protein n=1 Tax=Larkinella arboricola TaxID=643671 RepID=A0A327WSK8_LARAB|nr:hypothetical protein LX87_03895 [Larkinella arboricola]
MALPFKLIKNKKTFFQSEFLRDYFPERQKPEPGPPFDRDGIFPQKDVKHV